MRLTTKRLFSLDAIDDDRETVFPGFNINPGAEFLWHQFDEVCRQVRVVFGLDVPAIVLSFQMSQVGSKSRLVIQQTNANVNSTNYSFGVSFKLWRQDIVGMDASEQCFGLWVIFEKIGEDFNGELQATMT